MLARQKVHKPDDLVCRSNRGIWVIAPSGEVIGVAPMPEVLRNLALAFGGTDFRTLYLSPSGSLCKLQVNPPGIGAYR